MIEAIVVVSVLSLVFYRVVRGPHFQKYRARRSYLAYRRGRAIEQYTAEDFLEALNDSSTEPPHPLWFRLINEKRLEFLQLNHAAFIAAFKIMEETSEVVEASFNRMFDLAQTQIILNDGETFDRFCAKYGLTG